MSESHELSSPTRSARLIAATSAHLDRARSRELATLPDEGLRLPAGGLESPALLAWLDRIAVGVQEATGERGIWLIAAGHEVVGLISFKGPPHEGVVEIGYGVVASRRGRGHATRAVALVLAEATRLGLRLRAETSLDNLPSQRVLERNGFRRVGERHDVDEGHLVLWSR